VAGTENLRRSLTDWLEWAGFIDAGGYTKLDRYIGYYEPYATSHETLDEDEALQNEVRVAAQALYRATIDVRSGRREKAERGLERPRPK
jgi:hypothetical protein